MSKKLIVEKLTRVYGDDPQRALAMLEAGADKDTILKRTGMTVGVDRVDFSVAEGEFFVVMGLSGSGKSTLIRLLNRLIEPTSGDVRIDGESVTRAAPEALRRIRLNKVSMVFQHFALFPHRSVRENVEFGLKARGVPRAERAERALAALAQVGLEAWADSQPRALSGGMQQRVGLARCLAVDPEILLMDEPFSALDPLIRREMHGELAALQAGLKKTVVFITHNLDEALTLGDRIAIMKDGRFVQVGTPAEIVDNPADDYVAAFTVDVDRSRVFLAESVIEEAAALELAEATPRSALERMGRLGRDALYVTDRGRIAGVVRARDLALAADPGGRQGLVDHLIRSHPQARPDAHLNALFRLADAGLPIAVVDRSGRLSGVVEPAAILARMGPGEMRPGQGG